MNRIDIDALNRQFSIQDESHSLHIRSGEGGLPVIEIDNAQASARIALHGAHLLSWIPQGEQEVIWLSPDARFEEGKSVRGGIPVCWPWFSAHERHADYPSHGFARSVFWRIEQTQALDDGATLVHLTLRTPAEYHGMWPADTRLGYRLLVGSTLQLELETHNPGDEAVTISQALHSYFHVGDVSRVSLSGLERTDYLDKLEGFARRRQQGPVTIEGEVDRIYLDSSADCIIDDPVLQRRIIIQKQGSRSTVVWNPWRETANRMGDLGPDGYLNMLCVESANAADDRVSIEAGQSHRLQVRYQVDSRGGE